VIDGSREITLPIPADSAWAALVSAERRSWYYSLQPHGDFALGGLISWIDGGGTVAEEAEVIEIRAPQRLALRSRFLFAPNFAASAPHVLTWDVEPAPEGCRVRIGWSAGDLVAGLWESEAGNLLQALRLELDPAAHAELARLSAIGNVEVHDVTAERLADYQSFFDHDAFRDFPTWQSCYCMETHRAQDDDEGAARTAADNRRDMSEMISSGQVTALLAYVDGKPVGWCNYGETTRLSGLMAKLGLAAADQEGVGSIACFVIASPYRGHGVASKLLEAAVVRLRDRGLRAVEGYPHQGADSAQTNYRGPLSMYLRAGFEPYGETKRNTVVRKKL
jgi:ribosomal protein S18 acetylase RimI-like enzyme